MEKLSEAGKLYLQDYYILNDAQNDVFVFLDALMNQVYQNVAEGIKDLYDPGNIFSWEAWKNESKPGRLGVWPLPESETVPFRKGKSDLYLRCCDVRHEAGLSETAGVTVVIRCTNYFLKSLKQVSPEILGKALEAAEKQGISLDVSKKNEFYKEETKLNLDSISESVDSVTECVLEHCQGLREFALQIANR